MTPFISSKNLPVYIVILFALLFASGCTTTDESIPPDLVIALPAGDIASDMQVVEEHFEELSGLNVQLEIIAADAYSSNVASTLLSGLDRYDLVCLPAESLGRWAKYNAIIPPGQVNKTNLSPWTQSLEIDGVLFGLPADPSYEVLWYRSDLLKSAGLPPPQNWHEIAQAAQALHNPPELYGFPIAGLDVDTASEFSAILASFGGQAINKAREVVLDEPITREALEFYSGLHLVAKVTQPDALTTGRSKVLRLLADGKAVFGIAPLNSYNHLLDCEISPKVCQEGKPLLSWMWLPGLPKTLSTGNLRAWAVPLHAAHPEAAWKFTRWLVSVDGAKILANQGQLPPNLVILSEMGAEGQAIANVTEHRIPVPPAFAYDQLWTSYNTAVHRALVGKLPVDLVLTHSALEMRLALYKDDY